MPRGQYALIADSVDFQGGFPRFPRPLFPPKETNTSDCFVRMKYGVFGKTKGHDSAVECLKGFKGFFKSLNDAHKCTNIYSYAFYPGPSFPTRAELKMGDVAGCPLSGISNPIMTPMARQLGHDGYSVAYVATKQEFDAITASKGRCIEKALRRDATDIVYAVSCSMMTFFKSSKLLFSPAAMNRARPSIFAASAVTEKRLHRELSGRHTPRETPQFQRIHGVDAEWAMISEAPARILRLPDRGRLDPGRRADLTIINSETRAIEATISGGRITHLAGEAAHRFAFASMGAQMAAE